MAKYFTLDELTRSSVAKAKHIDNTPPGEALQNLRHLADYALDPVRKLWGAPIIVNSGYRSQELNVAVGGAASSQHLRGEAADITTGTPEGNKKLFNMIIASPDVEFDQLIDESNYSWLHISYKRAGNRGKILHL